MARRGWRSTVASVRLRDSLPGCFIPPPTPALLFSQGSPAHPLRALEGVGGRGAGPGYRLKNVCPSRRPRSRPVRHTHTLADTHLFSDRHTMFVVSLGFRGWFLDASDVVAFYGWTLSWNTVCPRVYSKTKGKGGCHLHRGVEWVIIKAGKLENRLVQSMHDPRTGRASSRTYRTRGIKSLFASEGT